MEGASRFERKARETEARIVAAAAELALERGARGVTMDDIAERADVARRTLFNRFASKEAVLAAVCAPILTHAIELADERLRRKGSEGRWADVVSVCLALWERWGRALSLLGQLGFRELPTLAPLHDEYLSRFRALLSRGSRASLSLSSKIVYRCFVPLLLALEGEKDLCGRFSSMLASLLDRAVQDGAEEGAAAGAVARERSAARAEPQTGRKE